MTTPYKTLLGFGAALGSFAASAQVSRANTIFLEVGPQYGEQNPFQYSDGGEFTALSSSLGVPAGYSPLATETYTNLSGFGPGPVTGFETFCVEDSVYFYAGTTYDYSISSFIQGTNPPLTESAISVGTAWLYSQFAQGALTGYDYLNTPDSANGYTSRLTDAGELQSALWALEGEITAPSDDPYLTLAADHFGSLSAATAKEAPGQFGVQVLDLYTTDGNGNITGYNQDQLIYAPVPESGTMAVVAGAFLMVLVVFRRRLRFARIVAR